MAILSAPRLESNTFSELAQRGGEGGIQGEKKNIYL